MGKVHKSDQELLYLYYQNNEDALHLLREKYHRIIMAYIRRFSFSMKTSCELQDLYQIALIALYQSASSYKENMGCRYSSYFKIVMERSIFNHIRHLNTDICKANKDAISMDQFVGESEDLYVLDTIPDTSLYADPKRSVYIRYLFLQIYKQVRTMPKKDQKVFELWSKGYTYGEMSKMLGLSEKQIDNLLYAIRKKLRTDIDYI